MMDLIDVLNAIKDIHAGLLDNMDDRLSNPTQDKKNGYRIGATDLAVKLSQRISRG